MQEAQTVRCSEFAGVVIDRMQAVGRRSLGHAKECGLIVPQVLQRPTAVFEGLLRRSETDEASTEEADL